MALQARCHPCKVVFRWAREVPMRLLRCPRCGQPMRATSRQWAGAVEHLNEPPYRKAGQL